MTEFIEHCRDYVYVICLKKDCAIINSIEDEIVSHFCDSKQEKIRTFLHNVNKRFTKDYIKEVVTVGKMLANKLKELENEKEL